MDDSSPKDAGEALRVHGANGFREHVRNNIRPFNPQAQPRKEERNLPEIEDIMGFLAKPLSKPPELIKGILYKGSKLILSGAPKSRRTWALTHLAICVAVGLPWWGFETTPGRVLYANFELAPEFFQERLNSIKDHLFLEGSKLKGKLDLWNLRGYAADIEALADQIIEQTKDKYDLIILDPIYKILGNRDENSNSEVASMMNVFDRIIKDSGAAIAFAHHFSKGNQSKRNAMDRMSGAGAFARDADALLAMTENDGLDTYTVEPTARYHKPVPPFCVTVEHPIMVRNDQADPEKLKGAGGKGKTYCLADLMKVLNIQHLTSTEMEKQFTASTGASTGTFDKLLKEAKDTNCLEKCVEGKKWKAVSPVFPLGYNGSNHQQENSTDVQV